MRSRFIFRFRKNKVGCSPYIPSVFSLYFLIVLIEYWNTEDKYIRYDDTFVAHISFDHVIHKWLHTHTHIWKKVQRKNIPFSILIKKTVLFIFTYIYIWTADELSKCLYFIFISNILICQSYIHNRGCIKST